MPILLIALLIGTLAFLYWRRKTTTLTRNCRWREDRAAGDWVCAYCAEHIRSNGPPKVCKRRG